MMVEKDGNFVVTKLISMNSYPTIPKGELGVFVLVYLNYTPIPVIVLCDRRGIWPHAAYHGIGWISLPIYQPQQNHDSVYLECGE